MLPTGDKADIDGTALVDFKSRNAGLCGTLDFSDAYLGSFKTGDPIQLCIYSSGIEPFEDDTTYACMASCGYIYDCNGT